jgi:enoyl-CoA hydratase/carnithine racemase
MSSYVDYRVESGIATLTMNDPDNRNAMTGPALDELAAAFRHLNRDNRVRVAILTGAGSAFSAGANLKTAPHELSSRTALEIETFYKTGMHQVIAAMEDLEVPLIAAVNGPAYGGGCIVSCMCDIRIASASASFCEVLVKLRVVSGGGGAWIIQRIVGPSNYAILAFTGEPVNAEKALAIGLVSEVVESTALMNRANDLARRISVNSVAAVRASKRLMYEARKTDLRSHLSLCASTTAVLHVDDDHQEAMKARRERRETRFKGI